MVLSGDMVSESTCPTGAAPAPAPAADLLDMDGPDLLAAQGGHRAANSAAQPMAMHPARAGDGATAGILDDVWTAATTSGGSGGGSSLGPGSPQQDLFGNPGAFGLS